MATSTEKLRALSDELIPELLAWVASSAPLPLRALATMGEPLARDHLATFLEQPAEDVDATLARVIGLLEGLRSDDAEPVAEVGDDLPSGRAAEAIAEFMADDLALRGHESDTGPAMTPDDSPHPCTCPDLPVPAPPGAHWDVYVDPACPFHAEVRP